MKKGLKIIFFGTPDFAIESLDSLYNSYHELLCVVTSSDKKSGRGMKINLSEVKKYSIENDLKLLQPQSLNDEEFITELKQYQADLFVVVAFKFLPDSIINIPKYGSINIHPSILPKYRGSSPIQYALLNGDNETGVSLISLNKRIDSGAILAQKTFPLDKNANFGYLYEKLSLLGSEMLIDTIKKIKNNSSTPIIQDETKKTLAPKIRKGQYKIDWNNSSWQIHNQIRAFDPFPGAYGIFNNKRIKLFGSLVEKENISNNTVSGQLLLYEDKLLIKVGSGLISVSHIQLEGKNKVLSKDFIKTLDQEKYILE